IFSMQQDSPKLTDDKYKHFGKVGAVANILYGVSSASIMTVATHQASPIIAGGCTLPLTIIPTSVLATILVGKIAYDKFNETYEIRSRSDIPVNKESSTNSKK